MLFAEQPLQKNTFFIKFAISKEKYLQFYASNVNQAVDDGVDGETCGGVNLELARNVSAMGDNSVNGNKEIVGNLLVRHALHKCHYYLLFTF